MNVICKICKKKKALFHSYSSYKDTGSYEWHKIGKTTKRWNNSWTMCFDCNRALFGSERSHGKRKLNYRPRIKLFLCKNCVIIEEVQNGL